MNFGLLTVGPRLPSHPSTQQTTAPCVAVASRHQCRTGTFAGPSHQVAQACRPVEKDAWNDVTDNNDCLPLENRIYYIKCALFWRHVNNQFQKFC